MCHALRRRGLGLAYELYGLLRWRLLPHVTTGVRILLIQDGNVLLIRHSYLADWNIPGGGIKLRERLADAAAREAREEVGAQLLETPWLLGVYANFGRDRSDHVAVFVCEQWLWTAPSDRWEIEARALFALDAPPPDLPAGLRTLFADYLARRKGPVAMRAGLGYLTGGDA